MPTLLHPVAVNAAQFTWFGGDRKFVAEISDIGGRFGQVWDDSCDEGLTLVSQYPGQPDVVFVVEHTEVDAEGDILWWDLKPADPRAGVNFTLQVFND